MFPDLRLSVQCWLMMNSSYGNMWLSVVIFFVNCSLPQAVVFVALQAVGCASQFVVWSILSRDSIREV